MNVLILAAGNADLDDTGGAGVVDTTSADVTGNENTGTALILAEAIASVEACTRWSFLLWIS